MKTALKIARSELKMIFCTPIAWVMLMVFSVVCGLFFFEIFTLLVQSCAEGRVMTFQTNCVYANPYMGLFPKIKTYLFLFIPLISMGIISKDKGKGTAKFLGAAPITDAQVVWGKYLALLAYSAALVAVVVVYVIAGCCAIECADWGSVMTGLLGLFLLAAAYSAIGLFMSSLTSYQVVAALATFAALAVLNYIGRIGQGSFLMQDITFWLSISGRCENFIAGMISSEDVVYFLSIALFFVCLAIVKMHFSHHPGRRGAAAILYSTAVVCLVAVSLVSSRPACKFYHDSTQTRMLTLTKASQDVMKSLEGKVEMTSYANLLGQNFYYGLPSRYNTDRKFFEQYTRFKPDLKIRRVLYYKDDGMRERLNKKYPDLDEEARARIMAKNHELRFSMFKTPGEIASRVDLSGEDYNFVRHIVMKDGRSTFLRMFEDGEKSPGEKEITAAFMRLAEGVSKVGFVTGHAERSITGWSDDSYRVFATEKTFRHSLLNNGFDCFEVDASRAIDDDIDILIIADPRSAYSSAEIKNIAGYIASGRNIMIFGEPSRAAYVAPVAKLLGASISGRTLVESEREDSTLTVATILPSVLTSCEMTSIHENQMKVTMPGAATVAVSSGAFTAQPFLRAPQGDVCWRLSRQAGDREQKAYIFGDSDCFASGELQRNRYAIASGNFTLLYEIFRDLTDGRYPVDTCRHPGRDNSVKIDIDNLPLMQAGLVGGLPLLLLVAFILIYTRRKSR